MWNGIGVLAGLLLIALIVWQAIRLANINLEIGVTPAMVTAALSILLLIFVVIRFLDKPGPSIANEGVSRTIWAWIGLVLAIVIVAGAWMNMQAAGEGLADVQESRLGDDGGLPARRSSSARRSVGTAARHSGAARPGGSGRPERRAHRRRTSLRGPPDAGHSRGVFGLSAGGAPLHSAHGRDRHAARQDGPRRDAQGRRHHGRRRRRSGAHRRGGGRLRGHGARARAGGHQTRRRRRSHVRSAEDPRDPGGRLDPGDGEVPHRPLRRGADPRGARGRLHRRVRGADAGRRRAPRRQARVHRSRSSAARRTSARRCVGSPRARR